MYIRSIKQVRTKSGNHWNYNVFIFNIFKPDCIKKYELYKKKIDNELKNVTSLNRKFFKKLPCLGKRIL